MKVLLSLGIFWILMSLAGHLPAVPAAENPVWWERAEKVARQAGYRLVTLKQLQALYGSKQNFLIVDVRPDYEFREGHLPRSVQMEFDPGDRYDLKPDKRSRFKSVLGSDKNRRIIIYCLNYN